MKISYKGKALNLGRDFSMDMEETSPIFNEEGSQSVSATVPGTPENMALFNFPHRLDATTDPNSPREGAGVEDGVFRRSGLINITEASTQEGITFNIGFDNSTAYAEWHEKKLNELSDLPKHYATPSHWISEFWECYASGSPGDEYAIFPVALSKNVQDEDKVSSKTYWELLNIPSMDDNMDQPEKVMRIIENTPTQVTIPAGYGLTPFLKVWRVLELIFADLGVKISENPFKARRELARLVVLNNTADVICSGTLDYAELLPDVTVGEFMNALYVRFGLIFDINSRTNSVTMRLLDDIIEEDADLCLDDYITSRPRITFDEAEYIRLSAATSLDEAAPTCERFEDYIRGLDLRQLHVGETISAWQKSGSSFGWEGEFADGPEWEPEYPEDRDPADIPDPWEDYDWEDRWDDYYDRAGARAKTRSSGGSAAGSDDKTWLGRETVTGKWWKLDYRNNLKKDSSTGYFVWDPATPGVTAKELNSVDECVPIMKASTGATGVGNHFTGYLPAFLIWARHFHTYIKGSDKEEEQETTPLAFVWAYNLDGKSIGRVAPEEPTGMAIEMEDGGEPGPTLYFQFADGLFATYWSRYDELLRHGMRTVEIDMRLPKMMLHYLDILRPVLLHGCRCLINRIDYTLPAPECVAATVRLRTIQPLGKYDIAKEQNIPAVAMTALGLGWAFYEGDWQTAEDAKRPQLDAEALRLAREKFGDMEERGEGEELIITSEGVIATGDWVEEMPLVLPDSGKMPAPGTTKSVQFRGRVYYRVHLIKRKFVPNTNATISTEILPEALGEVYVNYTFDALYMSAYVVRR